MLFEDVHPVALPFMMITSFSRCCGACLTTSESRAGLAQYPRWIMSWSFGHLSTHRDSAANLVTRLHTVDQFPIQPTQGIGPGYVERCLGNHPCLGYIISDLLTALYPSPRSVLLLVS